MEKKKIIISEIAGFVSVILFVWLNEIIDLPHVMLGAPATPVNYAESVLESFAVLVVAALTISITNKLLKKIKHLEGFFRICCVCKKIYDSQKKEWIALEGYFDENSKLEFSHGLCDDCTKLYKKMV